MAGRLGVRFFGVRFFIATGALGGAVLLLLAQTARSDDQTDPIVGAIPPLEHELSDYEVAVEPIEAGTYTPGISKGDAIVIARQEMGNDDVAEAELVMFTDHVYGEDPEEDGTAILEWVDRPSWMVTFTPVPMASFGRFVDGATLDADGDGTPDAEGPGLDLFPEHLATWTVFIDADTGEFLTGVAL